METVADLANEDLRAHAPTLPHKLYKRGEAVQVEPAPSLDKQLGALPRDPYLGRKNSQLLQRLTPLRSVLVKRDS